MLNYRCPAEVLLPLVPKGVELDTWKGEALVSLVGFMFLDTRVRGVAFPGHRNFEEVNLRFYVRRTMPDGELRRGVVFVREFVPRKLIALLADRIYGEPYFALPMSHEVAMSAGKGGKVSYEWSLDKEQYSLRGEVSGPSNPLVEGSHEEFITEHYWGYGSRRNGQTWEYQVQHPRWNVWQCDSAEFSGDPGLLYGPAFGRVLCVAPCSALLAVGSEVSVYPGKPLPTID